jgi:hypothetical protein
MIRRLSASLFAVALLACLGGCASSVSVGSWQKSVEKYVRERGGGDPAVLRQMTWNDTQRGFSVIESDRPSESTDVIGLLLANIRVQDRPWIVFLVGKVSRTKAEEIRVAALSVVNGKYTWKLGPADSKALHAYQKHNTDLFHRRFPDQKKIPAEYQRFPREEDLFDVAAAGTNVDVTHRQSGARWHAAVQ